MFHLLQHVQIHKDATIVPVDAASKLEFSCNVSQQYLTVLTGPHCVENVTHSF
jgi:hypothetical protein